MTQAPAGKPASTSRPPRRPRSRLFSLRTLLSVFILMIVGLIAFAAGVPMVHWVASTGYIMSDDEVEIRPSVEGAVHSVEVRSGDLVQKGDLLIRLNDSIQRASYEQAKSELEAKRAQLKQMHSAQALERARRKEQVFQAEQSMALAKGNYKRMEDAMKAGGGFAIKEVEDARLRVQLAESHLAELTLPRDDVMSDQINVLEQEIAAVGKKIALHEAELDVRRITSPLTGNVFFNRFEPGEVVKPDHVLGQVFGRGAWVVKVKVPERHIGQIAVGQHVQVQTAAYPVMRYGYLEAKVTRIVPIVTPRPTGDGIFYMEATFDPGSGVELRPGMTATAYVDVGKSTLLQRWMGW